MILYNIIIEILVYIGCEYQIYEELSMLKFQIPTEKNNFIENYTEISCDRIVSMKSQTTLTI